MLLRIDPLAPEPIFEQIVHRVKGAVARGRLGVGDRLPSVRELARELRVNPNTVVRAYEALERDGVIVRRQGAGCFVTGRESALATSERRERLARLVERAVTEAYHLGFGAEEVKTALDAALTNVRFGDRDKKKRKKGS